VCVACAIQALAQRLRHRSTAEKTDDGSMRAAKRGNVSFLCTTFWRYPVGYHVLACFLCSCDAIVFAREYPVLYIFADPFFDFPTTAYLCFAKVLLLYKCRHAVAEYSEFTSLLPGAAEFTNTLFRAKSVYKALD